MALWSAPHPLVRAPKSVTRRTRLEEAGIPIEPRAADIDERAIERAANPSTPAAAAMLLAREKARAVSSAMPGRLVVGADQVLVLGERRFSKPADRVAARVQLMSLRGQSHTLHSAVAVARDGENRFLAEASARLTMRDFSDAFLDAYLDAVGPAVALSVGAYQLEGLGIH